MALYYGFRFIFPAKRSRFIRKLFESEAEPYQKSYKVIFDGKDNKPPLPNTKSFLAVSPHGILSLGWSYIVASDLFSYSETKWLVAPAMCTLPFIGDIMAWCNCDSCDATTMKKIMRTGTNVGNTYRLI